tara:strand:+ start:1619 stop:2656 length:1038 start_codon:yes stop_codon:yes gene_type:complete
MAFLDNSGDIILDAVLTDIGRRRMAQGNFRITKFSAGDDEIDYSLYNKDHPSGSAYYDLEIMQTPVLEAFTQTNANINYGLVSYSRNDLLYLPVAKQNEKVSTSGMGTKIAAKDSTRNVIFLADDTRTTSDGTRTSTKLIAGGLSANNLLISNSLTGRAVMIETGIMADDILPSISAQTVYITSVGLLDRGFLVRFDRRFISNVMGPGAGATFSNSSATADATLEFTLRPVSDVRRSTYVKHYVESVIGGNINQVYADFTSGTGATDTSTEFSVITGPRASFTAFNFGINPSIPQSHYIKFGTTSNNLLGDGQLYDFIDTTVYVRGNSSEAHVQIPIRIIKIAAT